MNDSVLNLLGLCRRAGRLSLGHDACKQAINSGKAQQNGLRRKIHDA